MLLLFHSHRKPSQQGIASHASSSAEDRCRVRHPVAATILGILRRAVQGEYRPWARPPAQGARQALVQPSNRKWAAHL
jgi:hypothetical protein